MEIVILDENIFKMEIISDFITVFCQTARSVNS
jgi:hypothetical protein